MNNQAERQNYVWRPNDNSSTTRLRYDLETQHWLKAFKNAQINQSGTSIPSSFGFITLVLSLVFSTVFLIVLLLVKFLKWLRSLQLFIY